MEQRLSLADLEPQKDQMQFCNMNNVILIDKSHHRKMMVTTGIATCLAVIIHHPQSSLTLFSRLSSSVNMLDMQNKFLKKFSEKEIKTQELYVYLAGGFKSFFESEQAAHQLKTFWEEKGVNLNTSLLFLREPISIDDHESFLTLMCEAINNRCDLDTSRHKNYFLEDMDSMFFDKNRLKNNSYCFTAIENYIDNQLTAAQNVNNIQKKNIKNNLMEIAKTAYKSIEREIKKIILLYLKENHFFDENENLEDKLSMAQYITNPTNESEKRIIILVRDPKKSVINFLGFDIERNKIFTSTEDCSSFIDDVITNTDPRIITSNHDSSNISIIDAVSENFEKKLSDETHLVFKKTLKEKWKEYPEDRKSENLKKHKILFFIENQDKEQETKAFSEKLKTYGFFAQFSKTTNENKPSVSVNITKSKLNI